MLPVLPAQCFPRCAYLAASRAACQQGIHRCRHVSMHAPPAFAQRVRMRGVSSAESELCKPPSKVSVEPLTRLASNKSAQPKTGCSTPSGINMDHTPASPPPTKAHSAQHAAAQKRSYRPGPRPLPAKKQPPLTCRAQASPRPHQRWAALRAPGCSSARRAAWPHHHLGAARGVCVYVRVETFCMFA